MKNIYTYLLLAGIALCCVQCESDSAGNPVFGKDEIPHIYLDWRAEIAVKVGAILEIKPIVSPSDHATYQWTKNGEVISTEKDLAYQVTEADAGDAELRFTVERYGKQNFRMAKMVIPLPPVVDPGAVTIAGVTWASRNLNAPGTFASAPNERGMLYQWSRNLGWPGTAAIDGTVFASDGVTNTWTTVPDGTAGDKWGVDGNGKVGVDPCPSGWRLPTIAEFNALLTANGEWVDQTIDGAGYKGFAFTAGGKTLFLPSAGRRSETNGAFSTYAGCYWSSDAANATNGQYLYTSTGKEIYVGSGQRSRGCLIRCVQKSEQ